MCKTFILQIGIDDGEAFEILPVVLANELCRKLTENAFMAIELQFFDEFPFGLANQLNQLIRNAILIQINNRNELLLLYEGRLKDFF